MTDRVARGEAAQGELNGAQFGDARLTARLRVIAGQAGLGAGESLPKLAGGVAELEATYRFLNNERVTPEAILAPHVLATRGRCVDEAGVLVVHDTTEFDFGQRVQLGVLTGVRKGFLGHFSLAVSGDGERRPLGVVHIEPVFRESFKGKGKRPKGPASEAARWFRGVDASAQAFGEQRVIHVMDREGDSAYLLRHLLDAQQDFVIRANRDRTMADAGQLRDAIGTLPIIAERKIELSERARNPSPRHRRRHPRRDARLTTVCVRAGAVSALLHGIETKLNVVVVKEVGAPAGQPVVEWVLWTTLPVVTATEALRVVDIYRARWIIEEYFRALKSGCAYESLQLESRHGLLNALAVFAPVAWLMLHLRATARFAGNEPADQVLSQTQLFCLRLAYRQLQNKELPPKLTARDAMLAVARLGGHLTQNGEPGWIVLGRGLHDVLMFELGYRAARGCDQS